MAKLNFDILGLEGFMVVSCPLCIISYDFQGDCIDLALELMVCPRTSLTLMVQKWIMCAVRIYRQC